MNRYADTKTIKDVDSKKPHYETSLPVHVDRDIDDIYIYTKVGDRLDLLANKYYGDPSYWVIIAATNHLGKGTLAVPAGIQIRIPKNADIIMANWSQQNKSR